MDTRSKQRRVTSPTQHMLHTASSDQQNQDDNTDDIICVDIAQSDELQSTITMPPDSDICQQFVCALKSSEVVNVRGTSFRKKLLNLLKQTYNLECRIWKTE